MPELLALTGHIQCNEASLEDDLGLKDLLLLLAIVLHLVCLGLAVADHGGELATHGPQRLWGL